MEDDNKIDFLNPGTLMFFIMGVLSDFCFLAMIGLLIPGVGFAIALFVLGAHYFFGLVILAFFFGKTKGWLSKAILIICWVLPLPLLSFGIALAVIASNKLAAFLIEQVAIQAVVVATAGAGEALEAGAMAAEGAEAAAEVTEAAQTIAEGVETAGGVVAETGEAAGAPTAGAITEGAEAGEAGNGVDDLESPEEKDPMENLKEKLEEPEEDDFSKNTEAEKQPEEEREEEDPKEKIRNRAQKVVDIADRRFNNQNQNKENSQTEEGEEEEDPFQQAA